MLERGWVKSACRRASVGHLLSTCIPVRVWRVGVSVNVCVSHQFGCLAYLDTAV